MSRSDGDDDDDGNDGAGDGEDGDNGDDGGGASDDDSDDGDDGDDGDDDGTSGCCAVAGLPAAAAPIAMHPASIQAGERTETLFIDHPFEERTSVPGTQ